MEGGLSLPAKQCSFWGAQHFFSRYNQLTEEDVVGQGSEVLLGAASSLSALLLPR